MCMLVIDTLRNAGPAIDVSRSLWNTTARSTPLRLTCAPSAISKRTRRCSTRHSATEKMWRRYTRRLFPRTYFTKASIPQPLLTAGSFILLQFRCQVTSYPVTSPTPYALGTTTISRPKPTNARVAPTYSCESKYTIQESDSCVSISQAKMVSTFALVYSNDLPAFCSDFPGAGTEICLPQQCNVHTVAAWDTCASIADANGITIAQLVEYNPDLNSVCGNLRSLLGYVICVSPLGEVTTTSRPSPTTTS